MSGMGSHHSHRAETTTWLTPKFILDDLGPFDLDPCAAPTPRPWPTATEHVALPEDGLTAVWPKHATVWCNPPYGRETWTWLEKLSAHPAGGIALIFARTETGGFVNQVWQKADALLFLHGRIAFCRADGVPGTSNSGAPSVLVAYGQESVERLRRSQLVGSFVHLKVRGAAAAA